MRKRAWITCGVAAGFLVAAGPVRAVIIHPSDDANIASIPRPNPNVVGQWGTNASAVAIAPNYILTARHPTGAIGGPTGVGTTVTFGGTSYVAAEIIPVGTADLRIVRITTPGGQPANLAAFTPVYTGSDAAPLDFTIGGYGKGRGANLTTTGGTYGYQWLVEGNTNQRFGRNRIEGSSTANDTTFGYNSDVLVADFDGPGALTSVSFEAMPTEFDSGAPWFVENGTGNWQVAAITRAIGHTAANASSPFDQALFASSSNAAVPSADGMDAVRLSSYRTFINANIPEPGAVGLLATVAGFGLLRRGRRRG